MNIVVAGGTGFIGSALCARLLELKHNIVVVSRNPVASGGRTKVITDFEQLEKDVPPDVVINLVGEPIADRRWTDSQKERISSSRLNTTQKIIDYFRRVESKPKLFISASAIGYYGVAKSDDVIDESSVGDDSFSSTLCRQWENKALRAEALGIRTCLLRTGVVLGQGGGALQKMLPLFRLGLGGIIGNGKQWMSWIHMDDMVGIILRCIDYEDLNGPINATAPNPVTNKEFTESLGKILKRPTFLSMPQFAIKLMMGQMGEELLLAGKKVVPLKAVEGGYQFKYKSLDSALLDLL